MANLNQVSIIGYLGDDPKVNVTKAGRKVANITVATTEKGYNTQNGTSVPDRTEWHSIVLWGKQAEYAERYLRKGNCVFVQGRLHSRDYEDRQGVKRHITEVEAITVQSLERSVKSD